MGIEGLIPFLTKKCPECLGLGKLTSLSGKRIAVDASTWIVANTAIQRKKVIEETKFSPENLDIDQRKVFVQLLRALFYFVLTWLNYGISPIFVFDGDKKLKTIDLINLINEGEAINAEQKDQISDNERRNQNARRVDTVDLLKEKAKTTEKRRLRREEIEKKIHDLKELLYTTDPLLWGAKTLTEYKTALGHRTRLDYDELEELKKYLTLMGIPCKRAKYDAEQYCSMLCREGVVAAVYSTDTDNIAYGCPLMIRSFDKTIIEETPEGKRKVKCAEYVEYQALENMLKREGFSRSMFVDLCILAECDYGGIIPGVRITTAFKLLKTYKTIEAIGQTGKDISKLNYEMCRRIFMPIPSKEIEVELFQRPDDSKVTAVEGFDIDKSKMVDIYNILSCLDGSLCEFVELFRSAFDTIKYQKTQVSLASSAESTVVSPLKLVLKVNRPNPPEGLVPQVKLKLPPSSSANNHRSLNLRVIPTAAKTSNKSSLTDLTVSTNETKLLPLTPTIIPDTKTESSIIVNSSMASNETKTPPSALKPIPDIAAVDIVNPKNSPALSNDCTIVKGKDLIEEKPKPSATIETVIIKPVTSRDPGTVDINKLRELMAAMQPY